MSLLMRFATRLVTRLRNSTSAPFPLQQRLELHGPSQRQRGWALPVHVELPWTYTAGNEKYRDLPEYRPDRIV
jgi:hypothetical protein